MIGEMSMSSGTLQMLEDVCCNVTPRAPYGTPRTLQGLPIKIDENVPLGEFVGEVVMTLDEPMRVQRITNIRIED